METLRVELVGKHAQSAINYELKHKQVLQERQKTFQEAFQSDMKIYKEAGTIPSKCNKTFLLNRNQLNTITYKRKISVFVYTNLLK